MEHQHTVTLNSVSLAGREILFPPTLSEFSSGAGHTHTFDIAPFDVVYEQEDLGYFIPPPANIPPGTIVVNVPPEALGFGLSIASVDEVLNHTHDFLLPENLFSFFFIC